MTWSKRGTRSEEIRAQIGAERWARLQLAVRRRDQVCQWPLPSGRGVCGAPIEQVDHRGDRNRHELDNLWGLCFRHHRRKTAKEAAEGRARAAAERKSRSRRR